MPLSLLDKERLIDARIELDKGRETWYDMSMSNTHTRGQALVIILKSAPYLAIMAISYIIGYWFAPYYAIIQSAY